MNSSEQVLKQFWGFDHFRPNQKAIVEDAVAGKDVLALLPTGGGKSICFQVPGLMREGVTVVISPLIALMQDQVDNLSKRGIRAKSITSGMSYKEIDQILDNARYGGLDFLYTSPERTMSTLFIERFKRMNVGLIVVDEAHCISEWGHDFRPSFMHIKNLRELKPQVPILALTATATERVKTDIITHLNLKKEVVHEASFQRPNLHYQVRKTSNKIESILAHCKLTDGVGIVYCQTRRSVKEMVKLLMSNRISCGVYHGGLTKSERERMLNDWMTEKRRIMVATNAFGMGIDKPNVRFVLHYEIPSSLEAYFQEAGRGGRDGETSKALLFFEEKDTLQLKESTLKKFPKKEDVLNTYRAISNYLKIAIGSGKDETYPLDLKKICQVFKLDYETTFHSLRILELNENLLFSEGTYHPTKLRFLVDNRELYNFQIQYESAHALSTLLTRSYPGIFDYFHAIHEDEICKRLKINFERLTQQLEFMQLHGIIDLNLRSNLPTVTYLTERLPDSYVNLKPEIYKDRRDVAIAKAEAMLQFCLSDECRTQQVIRYFGQTSEPCGTCDVCQRNKIPKDSIQSELIHLLERPQSSRELSDALRIPENEIKEILRVLLSQEIILTIDGKFYLN
ncbi:MAG: hypothetical protein RLZZ30_1324 [Bacteroidota bacterium]